MAIFYNPDDLAAVANGTISSFEPQPYAAKRFDENIFWRNGKLMEIASAVFDNINERLFVTEFNGLNDGRLLVHVFEFKYYNEVEVNINLPEKYLLYQNYPNPFNPSTTIKYSIPRSTEYYSVQQTTLKVFDILGREVATLVNKQQNAGNYEVIFNASNLSSGVYFYRLQSGNFVETKKLILLR